MSHTVILGRTANMDRRLLVLAMGMFALGADTTVIGGVLPEIARHFGVSLEVASQMTVVYAICFALMSPVIAAVAGGASRRIMLILGAGVFVVANLATAIAPTFVIALSFRALAGLGAAMFSPAATGSAILLVSPMRWGYALSIVVTGLTLSSAMGSTAVGSPIGAILGGLGDWRYAMLFVAGIGAAAGFGVWVYIREIETLNAVSLPKRLALLSDTRILLTVATTLLNLSAVFTVHVYFALVFDRAIDDSPVISLTLLVLFGVGGIVANLALGRLVDRVGSRLVILSTLAMLALVSGSIYWTAASLWSAIPAVLIWGACSWGLLVPQQYRLVGIAPSIAPILMGINTAASFLGISLAGVIGVTALPIVGAHQLGFVGASIAVLSLVFAELASMRIAAARGSHAIIQGSPA
jgi:MFS transporter, DHA1 family, inner membrane transport protein